MATLTTKTDDAGKPISYKFTCCVGRDDSGKQIWRTKTIKSPGLTPKREKDYVADQMAAWEKQQKADYVRTHNAVDKDKNARDSDIEASLLVALGCDKILQEFHGPRADDPVMKREMQQQISTQGYVMLDELTNISTNKVTLNTVNTYLLGMGLKSDLVSDTYILPKTSEELFD